MIEFPEFKGEAEKFAPIYIKEKWTFTEEKILYLFFKVNGYTSDEELCCVYIMEEPGGWYSIANEHQRDWYFRDDERHEFSIISEEEYEEEFNKVLTKIKEF